MKKIKKLAAIVGAAALISGGTALANQNLNVPEYDVDNFSKKIERYSELTSYGPVSVTKEDVEEGKKYNTETFFLYDRDNDGKTDLIRLEVSLAELKGKDIGYAEMMKDRYGDESLRNYYGDDYEEMFNNQVLQAASKSVYLAVDEEFNGGYDGYFERILLDTYNEKGEPFADGIYDAENVISPKARDLIGEDIE